MTDAEITVAYPDGLSWTWLRREDAAPVRHTCAPLTCEVHDRRFHKAWSRMVDVKRADRGLPPWRSDPKGAVAGHLLEGALGTALPEGESAPVRGEGPARARRRA